MLCPSVAWESYFQAASAISGGAYRDAKVCSMSARTTCLCSSSIRTEAYPRSGVRHPPRQLRTEYTLEVIRELLNYLPIYGFAGGTMDA